MKMLDARLSRRNSPWGSPCGLLRRFSLITYVFLILLVGSLLPSPSPAREPGVLILGDRGRHSAVYGQAPPVERAAAAQAPWAASPQTAQPGHERFRARPAGPIPDMDHPAIQRQIAYFTGDGRAGFEVWLARWEALGGRIQAILRDEGMPEDLAYVAFIESGLSPHAVSRAGAAGIWQFMPHTGRAYGLEVTHWVDDRRDVERSTRAAARHFADLYHRFGDWPLALAAYNAGQGRVSRAVRYSGSRDFWTLARRRYLRWETRNYVPRFYAARRIAANPMRYGFSANDAAAHAVSQHTGPTAYMPPLTDLRVIARYAGASARELRDLNPTLVQGVTPPGDRSWKVTVPPMSRGERATLTRRIKALPAPGRNEFVVHTVERGESARFLAITTGLWSTRPIRDVNPGRDVYRLKPGDTIVLPVREEDLIARVQAGRIAPRAYIKKAIAQAEDGQGGKSLIQPVMLTHRVRRGDTLWDISRRYRVSLYNLRAWNNLGRRALLHPGDEVIIFTTQLTPRARARRTASAL